MPADEPAPRGQRGGRRDDTCRSRVLEALGTVYDPELDEPITTLGFVGSLRRGRAATSSVRLRLPTPQCAPNFAFLMAADAPRRRLAAWPACGRRRRRARGPLHGRRDQRRGRRAAARSRTRSRARRAGSWTRCGRCSSARRCSPASRGCWSVATGERALGELHRARRGARARAAPRAGHRRVRRRRAVRHRATARRSRADDRAFRRMASLTALSLETNGGMCRDLLRVRYPEEGVAA